MGLPAFLLRKLYQKGSLRQVGDGRFAFTILNPIGSATVIAPPRVVINGVQYAPTDIEAGDLDVAGISRERPWAFRRGDRVDIRLDGHLLMGANRIHIVAPTKEFGDLEIFVEDRAIDHCDLPGEEE